MRGKTYRFKNKSTYSFNQKSTKEKGNQAEEIALLFLKRQGFSVIEKNFHSRFGEIDIIASKEKQLFFIEVKSSSDSSRQNPIEAVNYFKQQKIIKTSYIFLNQNQKFNNFEKYFSVIGIVFDQEFINFEWIPEGFGV